MRVERDTLAVSDAVSVKPQASGRTLFWIEQLERSGRSVPGVRERLFALSLLLGTQVREIAVADVRLTADFEHRRRLVAFALQPQIGASSGGVGRRGASLHHEKRRAADGERARPGL